MLKKLTALPVFGVCLLLGACATEGPMPQATGPSCDEQKVASVNDWASRRGYKVIWVTCPDVHKAEVVGQS